MATPNRRLERRDDVVLWLKENFKVCQEFLLADDFFLARVFFSNGSADKELQVTRVLDLSKYEEVGEYLEGQ